MKRTILAVTLAGCLALLTACAGSGELPRLPAKEGVAPYELSESEQYILEAFDMAGTSQILSFKAPEAAVALHINVCRLEEGGTWDRIGGGSILLGADRKPEDRLAGTFTMRLEEDHGMALTVTTRGRAAFRTEGMGGGEMMSATLFLQEFQEIALNTELPVALLVYDSGTSMRSFSMEDYFEPAKFADMDLVQAVTLEFSDTEE